MPESTLAQVITAITGIGTMVALLLGGVAALITARRLERKVAEVQRTGDENHKMLNQDRTDMRNYQAALIRALEAKGITVPIDQSAPQPPADR